MTHLRAPNSHGSQLTDDFISAVIKCGLHGLASDVVEVRGYRFPDRLRPYVDVMVAGRGDRVIAADILCNGPRLAEGANGTDQPGPTRWPKSNRYDRYLHAQFSRFYPS